MAGIAAAELHPELGGGEVELVVQHDHVGERNLVEALRLRDRAAGLVHEGRGLQEDRSLGPSTARRPRPGSAVAERARPVLAGDRVDGEEADIVPVARIACAGFPSRRSTSCQRVPRDSVRRGLWHASARDAPPRGSGQTGAMGRPPGPVRLRRAPAHDGDETEAEYPR